jgi:exosortase/archaeosortase family protein
MERRQAKILGISVLIAAFLLASANSIVVGSINVLDTDPSTYVIVVMLMLFVFMAFSLKEDLKFEFRAESVAYATAIFAAYLLLLSYLRVALSFAFLSYRVDALLFPLLLVAMIAALFGLDGVRKMKYLVVYAVFASPLLLLPILSLDNAFAGLNAGLVYSLLKAAGVPVTSSGLIINLGGVSSVAVSTTCVSLGMFAAFAMFLLPLAYLYEGDARSKAFWVISGCVLLVFLNIFRMLGLSLVWAAYGPSAAAGTVHAFAGQLLFYIGMVVMILIAYRYGLSIKRTKRGKRARKDRGGRLKAELAVPAAFAIAFGIIAFFMSSQYATASYVPAVFFGRNASASNSTVALAELRSIEPLGANVVQIGPMRQGNAYALQGSSANSSTYVIMTTMRNPSPGAEIGSYNSLSEYSAYVLNNGVTIKSEVARSGNATFYVNYFALPYNFSGSYMTVSYELFRLANGTAIPSCIVPPESLQDSIEQAVYNAAHLSFGRSGEGMMCDSYRIAEEVS